MPMVTQQPSLLAPLSLEELGQLKLALPNLNIISYRGPGQSGGVSSSLQPLTEQLESKINWIALSGLPTSSDRQRAGFSFHQPEIPASLIERHAKTCSQYLSPLLHGLNDLVSFDPESWRSFRHLNELVATECLRLSGESFPTLFWIHDYELSLVAPLLAIQAGAIPCQFWHVPWPAPDMVCKSPICNELVEALLANRLLGFHTTEYALNFLNTVQEIIPHAAVDVLNMKVRHSGSTTQLTVMPLGLDFSYWHRLAKATRPAAAAIPKKYGLANQLVLGIDRLEHSKGVVEKLQGLDVFLENHTGWHRRFHYVQLAQPAHRADAEMESYAKLVQAKVAQINKKYHLKGWEPIVWLEGQFSHKELAAWYQTADVLAVTPIRDGLNLIAKEFVACREDEQGALVLSRQAGCSAELNTGAILVNATDARQISDSIAQALAMSFEEKRRRMLSMRHVVAWNQLDDWACGFLRQAVSFATGKI